MESSEPPSRRSSVPLARAAAGSLQLPEAGGRLRNPQQNVAKAGRTVRPSWGWTLIAVAVIAAGLAIAQPATSPAQAPPNARAFPGEIVAAIVAMIAVMALLSASEAALSAVRRSRLRQLAEEGARPAAAALRLAEEPARFQATTRIGTTLAGMFAAALAARTPMERLALYIHRTPPWSNIAWLEDHAYGVSLVLVILVVGLAAILLGELIPRHVAARHAETTAMRVAGPIEALAVVTYPFVSTLTFLTTLAARPFGGISAQAPLTEEEIKDIVEESEKEGVLEEQETEMIHSVLEFTDIVVREVMVPRIDMVCVEVGRTIDDLLEVVLGSGHTRIPIYEETVDNIVGIVHAKDLLRVVRDCPGQADVRSANVMRSVYYVPENMKVDDLLAEFQRSKHQMAVVVDEYGGTAGLVTLEDLIEEIVGPITDEYDVENEPTVSILDDESALVDARMPIDDVNEALSLRLPEEDSETLGGFVFTLLGKIPVVGEMVDYDGLRFEVVEADSRRVTRVKIARLPEDAPAVDQGSPSSAAGEQ